MSDEDGTHEDQTGRVWIKNLRRAAARLTRRELKVEPTRPEPLEPDVPTAPRVIPPRQRLLEAGIFDLEYYAAQAARTFDTDDEAAMHCVRVGMPNRLSPHPLLEMESLPGDIAEAWRGGRVGVLVAYLRSERARTSVLGPLFDCTQIKAETFWKRARTHKAGAFGLFLETADASTPLPVPDDYWGPPPTFGAARERLLEFATVFGRQRALTRSRSGLEWDEDAERHWKAQWTGVAFPAVHSPLVSVIMPVRNRPEVVQRAIASVRRQTLRSWELLVVDDGSTDDTPTVVDAVADADERVRVLHRGWGGVSAARNAGLHAAEGRYVAFLDSDNEWREDFLELAVAAMHVQGIETAYAAIRLIDKAERQAVKFRAYDGGLEDLMVLNHVDLNGLVTTRASALSVGGFDQGLRRWVDHDFALKLAKRRDVSFLPFIGCDYDDSSVSGERISTRESNSWQYVVLGKHWVDWKAVNDELSMRKPGLVSIIIPTYTDHRLTVRAVRAALENADYPELECVVVDNGSPRTVGININAQFLNDPRVRYIRLPRNLNFAIGCNVGFAASTGANVVFLNNDTEARKGWLPPLLRRLKEEQVLGVQPLLLYADDTIQSAGTVFPAVDALPCHYLAGHPMEDGIRSSGEGLAAVTGAALAMRADVVAELHGFDPFFVNGLEDVDLCLRAVDSRSGFFCVDSDSVITHYEGRSPGRSEAMDDNRRAFLQRWRGRLPRPDSDRYEELGLTVAHIAGDEPQVAAPTVVVTRQHRRHGTGPPGLRWGLRIPSIPGPWGDAWGDTHFARALGQALGRLGQDVVTYRHGAHGARMSYLDDVSVAVRGLDVIAPRPGKINILWVISHPESVQPEELDGYDLVFAASSLWSDYMSSEHGRRVEVLHQATDSTLLPDMGHPPGDGVPVFVGATHHRRQRKIVQDAVSAGLDIALYGPGWGGLVPGPVIRGEYLPNHRVKEVYRQHGIVLADHWPDMARWGFMANRLFDAVAAGARVVSDDVPGIGDLFGGAVQTYDSIEDLRKICQAGWGTPFPSPTHMAEISQRIVTQHSFDRRAEQLMQAVLAELDGPQTH